MQFVRTITPGIVISDQPSEADLSALKADGFVGVVNLRNDGEPEQPIGTAAEGHKVRALGLDYYHMGVGSDPFDEVGVGAVCKFIDDHAGGKVLVHCRKGGRAAAVVLLQQAIARGWSADEAVAKGREVGLQVDGGLKTLVEGYLRAHPGKG